MNIDELAAKITNHEGVYVIDKNNPYHEAIRKLGDYDYAMLSDAVEKKGKTLYWEIFANKFTVE